jgi:hypothetical protein
MPRFGLLDAKKWSEGIVAQIHGYKTEPWILKGAQILNIAIEIDDVKTDALLPPAMHPAIPSYALFNVMAVPDSPVGKFTIAEIRIAGRTGVRPRGFVLRSYVDSEAARRELSQRWGFPVVAGEVELESRHDRVVGRVRAGGKPVLECEMLDRDFISGNDIQYIASMHLARNKDDGKLMLIQVDPEFTFSKAERGRPRVNFVDHAAWKAGANLELHNPIAASFAVCDVTLPKIRYVVDPDRPAMQGTTKVAA